MRKQDKRITVGMVGAFVSMILFIASCFVIGDQAPLVNIFLLCLTAFFIGCLRSIRLGILLFAGIIAVLLLASFVGNLGGYLADNGYISESARMLLGSLFFPAILLIGYFVWKLRAKKPRAAEESQEQTYVEEEGEALALDSTFLLLIKPNAFKVDMVYKVFEKDDSLFFCRVGGQFYEISESVFDLTPDKEETQLLSEKDNFKVARKDINSVTLDKKKSMWTGAIPNNGIIEFTFAAKAKKFIIHPAIGYDGVVAYFRNTDIPVNEKR